MAMNNISTAIRNAAADAFADAVDVGGGAGTIKFYTAGFAALLATLTFSATAFDAGGTAGAGICTADAVTADASADASGTVAVYRIETSASATCWEGTAGETAEDIVFNVADWVAGDAISLTAYTITVPAS
jgi:hypothetical protein